MAISSNETVSFNLDNVTDNQILVYDAATGSFKNETSAVSANANVTGQGRNVGSQGVGLYKQNDGSYLEFYKLQSGANTTLTLTDNVLFIDAVVGSSSTAFGSANANTVAVHDANGNVLNGSDSLTFDGTTFSFLGSSNNVTVADGLVTSNNLNRNTGGILINFYNLIIIMLSLRYISNSQSQIILIILSLIVYLVTYLKLYNQKFN